MDKLIRLDEDYEINPPLKAKKKRRKFVEMKRDYQVDISLASAPLVANLMVQRLLSKTT